MKIKNNLLSGTFLCMLALGSLHSNAQQVHRLSVDEAVDYALKNAPAVKNALTDIQIQKQVNNGITAAAYPQISADGGVQYNPMVAVQTFPNFIAAATYGVLAQEGVKDGAGNTIAVPSDFGVVAAAFGTKWNASAGVQLTQLLFDGQVFVGLQARDASMRLAEAQKAVTEEQIAVNVQKIYYQLVVGRQQVTSVDANIDRFEKLLHDTRVIFDNGFAERLDVDKVTVQLNNLKTEKVKIENQLRVGNAGLKFLLNMPQKDSLLLTDSLTEDVVKHGLLDTSVDYTNRRDYQMLTTARELNSYNIKRYQYSALPTVAFMARLGTMAQRSKFNFFNDDRWYANSTLGLSVNVPIFDGFARRSNINKARLEVQKLDNNLEQLRSNIDNEVEVARISMESALITMDNQQRNMQLAEKVYNTTKLKYEQGLGSNQEIYNAQTELKVAQNNYYSALYDAVIARVDFLKATGKLNIPLQP